MDTTLAERVTAAREYADLTKTELGKAVGMTKQAIGQIENGETKSPTPANLFAIAKATNTSAEWIAIGNGAMRMVAEPLKTYNKEVSAKEEEQRAKWMALYDNLDDSKRAHLWALGDSLNEPDEEPTCPDEEHCHHEKTG